MKMKWEKREILNEFLKILTLHCSLCYETLISYCWRIKDFSRLCSEQVHARRTKTSCAYFVWLPARHAPTTPSETRRKKKPANARTYLLVVKPLIAIAVRGKELGFCYCSTPYLIRSHSGLLHRLGCRCCLCSAMLLADLQISKHAHTSRLI